MRTEQPVSEALVDALAGMAVVVATDLVQVAITDLAMVVGLKVPIRSRIFTLTERKTKKSSSILPARIKLKTNI